MKIRFLDGTEFEGTPIEILRQMKEKLFHLQVTHDMTVDEVVDFLRASIRKVIGRTLEVPPAPEEERAERMLDEMVKAQICENPDRPVLVLHLRIRPTEDGPSSDLDSQPPRRGVIPFRHIRKEDLN